jgi:hypothetical protein
MSLDTTVEREIKLSFEAVEVAREAVLAAAATPLLGRRLQEDSFADTETSRCDGAAACCASASSTARAASRSRVPSSRRS